MTPAMRIVAAVSLFCCGAGSSVAETYRLREGLQTGVIYHVSSRGDLEGSLQVPAAKDQPPRQLSVNASNVVEYDERILEARPGEPVGKTLRVYQKMAFQRKVGDQAQSGSLRPGVRRMVLLRAGHTEVPFSPDGPLLWSEIERVRTDVFTPALAGLLPEKEVRVGDRWRAADSAVQELTDLEQLGTGQVECVFHEVVERNGRKYAHLRFFGTVTGMNEDGPNRQHLEGFVYFDLQSQYLAYLSLKGISWLTDKNNTPLGRIEGQFVLTRRVESNVAALSDDAIRRLPLEPNAENTRLLFEEPSLGVRFLYPRRWTVRSADARQIVLDEPTGGGVLITLEPANLLPTGAQFQSEVVKWLQGQKAKVHRANPVRQLTGGVGGMEHFQFEVELAGKPAILDYYVLRQQAGGATFASRLPPRDAAALQTELELIAQSLRLVPPPK